MLISLFVFLFGLIGTVAAAQEFQVPAESANSLDIALPESLRADFEEVLGLKPRWEPVTALANGSSSRILSRSVGRLRFTKNGLPYTCTAFLVDYNKIITNNHCITSTKGRARNLRLDMGYVQLGRHETVQTYVVKNRPLKKDDSLDFALMEVQGRPGDEFGFLSLAKDTSLPQGNTFIIHHPAGQPKKVTRDGCRMVSMALSSNSRWPHSCDTVGGSSGSPIFDARGRVVALHFAASQLNDGRKINLSKPAGKIHQMISGIISAPEIVAETPRLPTGTTEKMKYFKRHNDEVPAYGRLHTHSSGRRGPEYIGFVFLGYADFTNQFWYAKNASFPNPTAGYSYGPPEKAVALANLEVVKQLPINNTPDFVEIYSYETNESYRLLKGVDGSRIEKGSSFQVLQVIARKTSTGREEVWARIR